HLQRGHPRQAATGPAAPFVYTLDTQLLAAIYHHRLGMPYTHIAALLGAHHSTIAPAGHAVTALLSPRHPALAPRPAPTPLPQPAPPPHPACPAPPRRRPRNPPPPPAATHTPPQIAP